jgi:hypothetical protein
MSQVALRAGKNHRCFGLVDHPTNMPRDSPFQSRESAAIEVTDATRMAASSSPARLLNCRRNQPLRSPRALCCHPATGSAICAPFAKSTFTLFALYSGDLHQMGAIYARSRCLTSAG